MPARAPVAIFGDALVALGASDARIVTVEVDPPLSTTTEPFARAYPARAFRVGSREGAMIGLAAGLALAGRVPFACVPIGRAATVWASLSGTGARVRLVATHPGIATGVHDSARMGVEDIACLRALPDIAIVQPADEPETRQAVAYAVDHPGPIYLRLSEQPLEPVPGGALRFAFGRAEVLRPGHDVTVLATGEALSNALRAAAALAESGIECEVLNVSTLRPLDEETLLRSAGKTGHVVTVEGHGLVGGLGSAAAELLAEEMPTPLRRLGISALARAGDRQPPCASRAIDPDGIAASIRQFLER